ncbi:hypothetical protein QQG74_09145 [Micromonospora sp. FIMYZ51]|uniref:hypothetical protein n=1 Tax=Micromonospora sp. FIMYZ51 TaxID=3051832 RepID=UPI00311F97AC
MPDSPRHVRVKPARAIIGGVVHEAPPIATPGVTIDPDGMVRDPDGWPLVRLVNADGVMPSGVQAVLVAPSDPTDPIPVERRAVVIRDE